MTNNIDGTHKQLLRVITELKAIRQCHWDMRQQAGLDNDGDKTPEALVSDFAALMRNDWEEMIKQYKELADESEKEAIRLALAVGTATKEIAALKEKLARYENAPTVGTVEHDGGRIGVRIWNNFIYHTDVGARVVILPKE